MAGNREIVTTDGDYRSSCEYQGLNNKLDYISGWREVETAVEGAVIYVSYSDGAKKVHTTDELNDIFQRYIDEFIGKLELGNKKDNPNRSYNNVMGVVNSQENIDAVQFYRDLYECCQVPGLSNAFFTETNDAMIGGQAAMIMNYFAFFPALASPDISEYADVTGYFPNPAGPGGAQHAALGGQGMSIISYIPDERKQAAMDFIEWYAQDDIQAQFAALGGYSTNNSVVESQEFLEAAPFNPAFAETMTFVKDFWNIPEYGELLEVTQRLLSQFIVEGVGTAEETMNQIAEEHDAILRDAGYIE